MADRNNKDMKRLSRGELVEIIYEMQKREDEYKEKETRSNLQGEEYRRQISELEEKLADRDTKLTNAGSIAEASLAVSSIFTEAQAVADQYLHEVERLRTNTGAEADTILSEAKAQAEKTVSEAEEKAEKTVTEADAKAASLLAEAEEKAERLIVEAEAKSQELTEQAVAQGERLTKQAADILAAAQSESQELRKKTDSEMSEKKAAFQKRVQELLDAQAGLQALLAGGSLLNPDHTADAEQVNTEEKEGNPADLPNIGTDSEDTEPDIEEDGKDPA